MIDAEGYNGYLIAVYLFDETALHIALQEVDDQSLSVGMIYLDNYEEALESVEEVRRSLLIALIDRKVNKYIAALDGISKKLEKDKYLVIMRKKAVAQLQENRFDLLERGQDGEHRQRDGGDHQYRYRSGWTDLCAELRVCPYRH